MKELICIVCPKGCHLKVSGEKDLKVTGNGCVRGEKYAVDEITNPKRVITSTVYVEGADHKCCPVKTNGSIPKGMILEAMELLKNVKLKGPINLGEVVVKNICGTGVDFITTKKI